MIDHAHEGKIISENENRILLEERENPGVDCKINGHRNVKQW